MMDEGMQQIKWVNWIDVHKINILGKWGRTILCLKVKNKIV